MKIDSESIKEPYKTIIVTLREPRLLGQVDLELIEIMLRLQSFTGQGKYDNQ